MGFNSAFKGLTEVSAMTVSDINIKILIKVFQLSSQNMQDI
jgi:hypothetical protein